MFKYAGSQNTYDNSELSLTDIIDQTPAYQQHNPVYHNHTTRIITAVEATTKRLNKYTTHVVILSPALTLHKVCNNDINIGAHCVQNETQDDAVRMPDIDEDASNSALIEDNNGNTSTLNKLPFVIEIEDISKIKVSY